MATSLLSRVEAVAAPFIFGLPEPARRLIAGRPVRLDGQELALDAQLLLRLQQVARVSMSSDTPEKARQRILDSGPVVSGAPIEPVRTREIAIPAEHGPLPATLYEPAGLPPDSALLVFFHGGGWVIGSRASHDNTARYFAKHSGVRVLSVEYRLAPEHPFPAATEDAVAAFGYAHAKAADLGADPERIAVGGDSAGGNLAAVTAQVTTRRGGPVPAFQMLLYPGVDASRRRRSRELFGSGFFLTDADMTWFLDHYAPSGVDRTDTRLSPLLAEDFTGLPPAYVATAGFDPLRDEGEEYATKLRAAGVPVTLSRQPDLIHGYVNFLGIGRRFREATSEAAGALRVGLRA
ncbi:alpha/beta hydrolase [Amycolatopsis granulosa]|uniref:alpha/beta hydrolase n=1 Tax=Amycolatopsis granulosa TaxID=185684 RepID=UPI00141F2A25|nr:alpha/beta hydrolase [Amycolatopsis granulosa]NIH86690.1 acetyl esterase [Amycolatopsis granulosa]